MSFESFYNTGFKYSVRLIDGGETIQVNATQNGNPLDVLYIAMENVQGFVDGLFFVHQFNDPDEDERTFAATVEVISKSGDFVNYIKPNLSTQSYKDGVQLMWAGGLRERGTLAFEMPHDDVLDLLDEIVNVAG